MHGEDAVDVFLAGKLCAVGALCDVEAVEVMKQTEILERRFVFRR